MLGYFLDNEGFISYVDYVDENTVGNYTTQPIPAGLNKPKWNGGAWVEGMTNGELDNIHGEAMQPNATEIFQAQMLVRLASMQQAITDLQNQVGGAQ
ncbi:hypothetical protein [Ligilactobacillus cholophilus]|uniref:hypothetical protein n=1 Tax=Ligilactobacillus cholophilus TaxID=3050131 RepID=UPI0025B14215|nr:hypothetical protein [Ligilactobacillus cholophilus]